MEPLKNNNQSSEPVFHGMPKPGQPLATTPRVNATGPSLIATPPANLPTSNSFSAQASSQNTTPAFSAHTPSALDRLMNPNIDKQMPPVQPVVPTVTPVPPPSSVFKPYTPPVVPSTPLTTPPTPSTSGYKVGAPTQYPPVSPTSTSAPSAYSATPAYSAPSANVTASKLGSEVNSILNNQQKMPKSHKGTLILIISMIVVLLLLAGGGYYWYTYLYLPSKEIVSETTENSNEDLYGEVGTTNTNSAFPAAVTKPAVVVQPATTPAKTSPVNSSPTKTPAKVTRVTTPFNQLQRDMVSSYIVANINNFATPKSSTSYEVTDVTFDGPDRAVVQYTNGKSSYTAVAVASIDTADNVRIVSFSLLEK